VLNFIYYPVSAILWFWHKAFGFVFADASGAAWALAVVFLVFTLRALLYKPFVHQVRSMRKMQEFAPEIQRLKKKYGNDKQKMAAEMQKLQSEHGVSPLGGCLPMLVQVPVFIGLYHVLREFQPGKTENYIFNAQGVESFNDASIFGAKLGASLIPYHGALPLSAYHTTVAQMLTVMFPLMLAAGFFTHLTARHNVARQPAVQAENPQTKIMNKLTVYVFPIGVVIGAPFLPLAILFYWVSNNLWTLAQQRVVYKKIDEEEAAKSARKTDAQRSLAPKVGQKPDPVAKQRKPGAKPIAPSKGNTRPGGEREPGTRQSESKPVAARKAGSGGEPTGDEGESAGAKAGDAVVGNGSAKIGSPPPAGLIDGRTGANGQAGAARGGDGQPDARSKRGRRR
jgi:YidC/Oxa1 family membrane protein insertase